MSSVWCLADGCLAYGVFTDFLSGASVYIFSYYIYQIFFLRLRSHITRRFIIHAQYTHSRPLIWDILNSHIDIWLKYTMLLQVSATRWMWPPVQQVTPAPPWLAAAASTRLLDKVSIIGEHWWYLADWCCQICWRVPCPCPQHSGSAVL